MTTDRDEKPQPPRPDAPNARSERFDAALRDVVTADDDTSCEDADASEFLERFPAAAREPQRPKED